MLQKRNANFLFGFDIELYSTSFAKFLYLKRKTELFGLGHGAEVQLLSSAMTFAIRGMTSLST